MPRIPKRTLTPGNQRRPEPIRAAHPAVKTLWEMLRDRPDLTVKGIARKSGLSAEAIRGWRRGVSPRLADVEAVLNAMGLEMCVVPRRIVLTVSNNALS